MRVTVVGAGIAGLVAARQLDEAGVDVIIVDKGRSVGGRLATRRIGAATLDHGAQFFTVRTPAFGTQVADWQNRGLVAVWSNGFDGDDGHPRYVATSGMNSLAKDLATGLDVRCPVMAFAVRASEHGCDVVLDDATVIEGDGVVLTTPLPQAFSLLADSPIELDRSVFHADYDRTIALLAVLDGPPDVGPLGGRQAPDDDVAFVADNQRKGVSDVPALTLHAAAEWSDAHWDDDIDALAAQLEELAMPYLGAASIIDRQVKKWRFATPRAVYPEPCWTTLDGRLVLAGDAFAGPRVEGAHNSGLAAAHALLS
ncbi:MAG: FAD-dependent oxidoreductase [Actinomycetota bacterium]